MIPTKSMLEVWPLWRSCIPYLPDGKAIELRDVAQLVAEALGVADKKARRGRRDLRSLLEETGFVAGANARAIYDQAYYETDFEPTLAEVFDEDMIGILQDTVRALLDGNRTEAALAEARNFVEQGADYFNRRPT